MNKPTAKERGQRWRRKRERAAGKPRRGRPWGSKNKIKPGSMAEIREWMRDLVVNHGHSYLSAGAVIRCDSGPVITELMIQTWHEMGVFGKQRQPKHDLSAYNAVRTVRS